MTLDHLPEGSRLLHRQIVLGPAQGAGEMDVLDLTGEVVLGPTLQMGVADHPDLLEHGQGSVHGRGVHGRETSLDPPGDVLWGDVPPGCQELIQDHLPLRGDPVAPLPEHRGHGGGLIHGPQATAVALHVHRCAACLGGRAARSRHEQRRRGRSSSGLAKASHAWVHPPPHRPQGRAESDQQGPATIRHQGNDGRGAHRCQERRNGQVGGLGQRVGQDRRCPPPGGRDQRMKGSRASRKRIALPRSG